MKLLAAVLRYELLLQWRSPRFRIAVPLYTALSALPAVWLHFGYRVATGEALGAATYLAQTLELQPFLTALLVVLVAGNRSNLAAQRELWPVLASAPVTNAGYLLRRWLALLALLLPLSALPQLVALGLAAAAGGDPAAIPWIATWGLQVLPVVAVGSAFWLAWVTIAGGEIGAALVSLVGFPLLVGAAGQLLLRWRLTLSGYADWLAYDTFNRGLRTTFWGYETLREARRFGVGLQATEGPFDAAAAALELLPGLLPAAGAAALSLGLAAAFARRTRRDLPPRPVSPTHPLRNFLEAAVRQRQRWAPDGGLGLGERLAAGLGAAVFAACLAAALLWQVRFQDLAADRYRAETGSDFPPTADAVRPVSWSFEGRLEAGGEVAVRTVARLENRGAVPQGTLAFELAPTLAVAVLDAAGRRAEAARDWDRLSVRLDPPLAAGEALDLAFEVRGRPAEHDFPLGRQWSFVESYRRFLAVRFPRDVPDFGETRVRRSITERRIELSAGDLGPVPRYVPWTLIEGEDPETGVWGPRVPADTERSPVALSLALEAPAKWFLADSCGGSSRIDRGRSRLRSACRTALRDLLVAGGALVPAAADAGGGEVVFAALPVHRPQAEEKVEGFARVAALSERAWPGMAGLDGLVALEWPPPFDVDLRRGLRVWDRLVEPELRGRLMLIPERLMTSPRPLEPEGLVAQKLSRELLARRTLDADQEVLFRHLFAAVMLRRMGLDGGSGAAVSGSGWLQNMLKNPILHARPGSFYVWGRRLPAVLVEIESRVGSDHFFAGIEGFLAAGSSTPGTVEELLAELEARSGVSLQGIYRDHFQGDALPLLQLEEVRSRRRDGAWTVTGAVRNTGTGESVCPVIVKTEVGEELTAVTVQGSSASPFTVRSRARPHTVLLDPGNTCYRFQTLGSPVLERVNLLADEGRRS